MAPRTSEVLRFGAPLVPSEARCASRCRGVDRGTHSARFDHLPITCARGGLCLWGSITLRAGALLAAGSLHFSRKRKALFEDEENNCRGVARAPVAALPSRWSSEGSSEEAPRSWTSRGWGFPMRLPWWRRRGCIRCAEEVLGRELRCRVSCPPQTNETNPKCPPHRNAAPPDATPMPPSLATLHTETLTRTHADTTGAKHKHLQHPLSLCPPQNKIVVPQKTILIHNLEKTGPSARG
jgi:hypothetical protein